MYKITNKKTGFSQYRNAKDLTNFIKFNSHKKYNIEEVETYDIKNLFWFLTACAIVLILTFSFLYFGAETNQWINE